MSYASYAKVLRPAPDKSYAEVGMGPKPPKKWEVLHGVPDGRVSYATLRMAFASYAKGFWEPQLPKKSPKCIHTYFS